MVFKTISIVESDWRSADSILVWLRNLVSFHTCNWYKTLSDALVHLRRDGTDILIVSGGSELGLCESIRSIKRSLPALKILVVNDHITLGELKKLMESGVDGLSRRADLPSLEAAIKNISMGNTSISSEYLDLLVDSMRIRNDGVLTQREKDVLLELSKNKTYQEICNTLGFTRGSLSVHICSLYRKLGVNRRSDAIKIAYERKYLSGWYHTVSI